MRSKLVQICTVGLITLLVLSPELVILSIIWEQHIEWVQTQGLSCDVNQSSEEQVGLASLQDGYNSYENNSNSQFADTKFNQRSLTNTQNYKIVKILQLFFLLFPIFVGVFVILYDRYLIYRASVLQQQVEMLERVWQNNIE
ncbi:MAG: hypothetical protein SAL70_39800 [Scytonema sp. PMC 1070.18]|nr:hypothetical protein [Scytonema sp. PMC 1070.18]